VCTESGQGGRAVPPAAEPRDEMHAAPPFLSWAAIYAIVIGALAAEVVICAALTR
jgi:hypothetical protein